MRQKTNGILYVPLSVESSRAIKQLESGREAILKQSKAKQLGSTSKRIKKSSKPENIGKVGFIFWKKGERIGIALSKERNAKGGFKDTVWSNTKSVVPVASVIQRARMSVRDYENIEFFHGYHQTEGACGCGVKYWKETGRRGGYSDSVTINYRCSLCGREFQEWDE